MVILLPKVELTPLFCDKMSLTYEPPIEDHAKIIVNVKMMLEEGYAKPSYTPMYDKSISVFLGNSTDDKLLIQYRPKMVGPKFVRLEFNPSKGFLPEIGLLLNMVFPQGVKGILEHSACTRGDLTVDCHGIDINDLLVWYPQFQRTQSFCRSGKLQTYYLGATDSSLRICVYDLVAKLKRENYKRNCKHEIPGHAVTRVEARVRKDVALKSLGTIPNPFKALHIATYSRLPKAHDEKFNLFMEVCRSRGTQDALLMLDESTRKVFRQKLETGKCKWWQPDDIGMQWPLVVKTLHESLCN